MKLPDRVPLVVAIAAVVGTVTVGLLALLFSGQLGIPQAHTGAINAECLRMVREFEDYPVLFPGESAFGLPLTNCDRSLTSPRFDSTGRLVRPGTDTLALIYGDCEPSPDASCPPPVQVILEPPCSAARLDQSQRTETVRVRGVNAFVKPDGSVRIETEQFKISLFVLIDPAGGSMKQRQNALALARLLRGGNRLAAAVGSDALLDVPLERGRACE